MGAANESLEAVEKRLQVIDVDNEDDETIDDGNKKPAAVASVTEDKSTIRYITI